MDRAEVRRRIKAVRSRFGKPGIDAFLVTGLENVRYLTGFRGHDSWALVMPRAVYLLTDSRYTEQAQSECVGCKIVERKGSLIKEADAILARTKGVCVLGIEDTCSVALLKHIRKGLSVTIKPLAPLVENVRLVKSPDEIKLLRKAGKIAFDAMDWALQQVAAGMTELELAALYEYRLRHYDATPGFETIVCFGANGSRNHHQPGKKKLRKNDTILLDFGANYQGYISDTTRCYAFGKVTPFFRRVYTTVAGAQRAAIEAVGPGVRACDVDAAARAVIAETDFPMFGHGTGHGIGLEIHEQPGVSKLNKNQLQPGQVITIEPGIYLPGKLGVRLEDDVLITETGFKVISRDRRFDIKPDIVPLV